jgi:hypothetical protein
VIVAFITEQRDLKKKQLHIFGETIGQMCVDARVKKKKEEIAKTIVLQERTLDG